MRIQVLYTADLKFYAKAVLLTSIIALPLFPDISSDAADSLPNTVTASLRILTGFPFHPWRRTARNHFQLQKYKYFL